jgi:hypothetical protein
MGAKDNARHDSQRRTLITSRKTSLEDAGRCWCQQTRHHPIGIGKFFTCHRCDIQDRITIITVVVVTLVRVVVVVTAGVVGAT